MESSDITKNTHQLSPLSLLINTLSKVCYTRNIQMANCDDMMSGFCVNPSDSSSRKGHQSLSSTWKNFNLKLYGQLEKLKKNQLKMFFAAAYLLWHLWHPYCPVFLLRASQPARGEKVTYPPVCSPEALLELRCPDPGLQSAEQHTQHTDEQGMAVHNL